MSKKILFVHSYYPGFLQDFYSQNKDHTKLSFNQLKLKLLNLGFGSANFYSKVLNKHGWVCDDVIANDFFLQSKWAKKHALNVPKNDSLWLKYIPESLKNMLGLRTWIKTVLFAQIEAFKPDIVYFHDLWLMNTQDLLYLKSKTKLIVGQIASPIPPNHNTLKKYDLIITSLPNFLAKFKSLGISTEYLRWCAEKSLLKTIGNQKRIYNTVFVGSFSSQHQKGLRLLKYLSTKVHLDLWGYGQTDLPNYHGHAAGISMYKIFGQAKIVVNRHIDLSENYANNMRMFEATLMGAMLLTD